MRSACETGSGRFRARRIAMLYGAYEFQRSMLAGASAMAGFGAELLNNPANPFAYFVDGPVMGSALEVFAHASAPRGQPDFGLTSPAIHGKRIQVREAIAVRKPLGPLQDLGREGMRRG